MNTGTPSLSSNVKNKLNNNTINNSIDSCGSIELASPIQLRRLQQRETDGQTDRRTDRQTIRSPSLSHLEDDARVEEDEEAKRYDENEDESGDDVAIMPVLVDGADTDGDVDAVDVVELRVREGDGQEGRGQQPRGHPHHRHQQQRLGPALRGVHLQRVAHGVVTLEADAQDDEDGGEAHHVLQKHCQLACNTRNTVNLPATPETLSVCLPATRETLSVCLPATRETLSVCLTATLETLSV